MACAYVFFIWSLLPLAFPGMTPVVQYVSQSIIQLVLLSVIMVGQDIANRGHEKRDNESHDAVMTELKELREMHQELREQNQQLHRLLQTNVRVQVNGADPQEVARHIIAQMRLWEVNP